MTNTISTPQFPAHLLTENTQAKVKYFKAYESSHPHLDSAHSRTLSALRRSSGPKIVMVTGPTGVGKTTLARNVFKHIKSVYAQDMMTDPTFVPIIGINAIPPNRGQFNWKDFYLRLLERHGDILIDRKLLIPRQNELFPEVPMTSPLDKWAPDVLRRSVESCIKHRKTKYLLIDEAHHLLMLKDPNSLELQFETLKSITIETGVTIILFGTYRLLDIRDQSGQLSRRSELIHFPRYDLRDRSDISDFASMLHTFQLHLPLAKTPDFSHDVEYFYTKSAGCIGILKDWLTRCLEECLLANKKTFDADFANKFAHSNKSLTTIIEEAMNGEMMLEDVGIDELRSLMQNGMRKEEPAPVPKRNRQPGKRNPTRDSTGERHGL